VSTDTFPVDLGRTQTDLVDLESTGPGFAELGVPEALTGILSRHGITTPTPIQAATLPDSMAGRDVLGRGRTGSGKTYAFLLPMVTRLAGASGRPAGAGNGSTKRQPRRPRALILAPTRELVSQIDAALAPLAAVNHLTSRTIFGGVGQHPQVTALRNGVDIIVACPGRLEDLIAQGHAILDRIQITVLDEADHMADLGFLPAVRRILEATPRDGQRMLFSATLDAAVNVVVKRFLNRPVTHEADSPQTIETMTHHVLRVSPASHLPVLVELAAAPGRTVVFARTKQRAKRFARQLNDAGVPTVELHGNLGQNARTRNMDAFHSGKALTLVATDIAARGIHVDDVGLVVHADPPIEHKAYLHRSGRTARAGNDGTVITLMTDAQAHDVRDLTRRAGIRPITTSVEPNHPLLRELAPGERSFPGALVTAATADRDDRSGRPRGGSGGNRSSSGGNGARQQRSGRPAQSSQKRTATSRVTGSSSARSGATARNAGASSARTVADFSRSRSRRSR